MEYVYPFTVAIAEDVPEVDLERFGSNLKPNEKRGISRHN